MGVILSKRSKDNLDTCHADIQLVVYKAAELGLMDFSVICGHRGKEAQEAAFKAGHSKAKWGQSSHNEQPSKAVDIVPYPIDWHDLERFKSLARYLKQVAKDEGVKLYWGGDWKNFKDYPHYSLTNK